MPGLARWGLACVQWSGFRAALSAAPAASPRTGYQRGRHAAWPGDRPGGGTSRGPGSDGLTFSGGEPMRRPPALADVARRARAERDLTLIVLHRVPAGGAAAKAPGPGVPDLLGQADVSSTAGTSRRATTAAGCEAATTSGSTSSPIGWRRPTRSSPRGRAAPRSGSGRHRPCSSACPAVPAARAFADLTGEATMSCEARGEAE